MPCTNHPEVLEGLNRCSRCSKSFCGDCLVELKGNRLCAACKAEQVKDIQSGVDPNQLPLAGIGARWVAQIVDGLVWGVVTVPVLFATGAFSAAARGDGSKFEMGSPVQLAFMAMAFLYEGIMLQWKGQTLGKMALKIKVVTPQGEEIGASQAWIRALTRTFLSFLYIVDYLPALFTKQKTCIHDMAAKTRVVKLRR